MLKTFSWSDGETWPLDGPGYTALPRGVDQIGRSLFGAEWLGLEGLLSMVQPTTKPYPEISERTKEAVSLLLKDLGVREVLSSNVVEADYDEYHRQLRDARDRFVRAKSEIRRLCAFGELRSAGRLVSGGRFEEMDPSVWNAEDYELIFRECKVKHLHAFPGYDTRLAWVFLSSEDLARVTSSRKDRLEVPSTTYLSPYMQLAIRCIEENALSKDEQSVKSSLEAWLTAHWSEYRLPPSTNLLSAMASIIREPESQDGRRKKSTTKKQTGSPQKTV